MIYFIDKYSLFFKSSLHLENIFLFGRKKSAFFLPMTEKKIKIKNLKISEETHKVLKKYCNDNGLKLYRFLETLILEKCKQKPDIYGED